jgi:hypothetical protein
VTPLPGRPVVRGDIEALAELTAALASPLSEYCAANLYLFRAVHDYRWADGGPPALIGRTYDGVRHLAPLVRISYTELSALSEHLTADEVVYPLAEAQVEGLAATADPDDSDYLYGARDLAELSGEARKAKRNSRSRFRRIAEPRDEPVGAGNLGDALRVLDGWLADVGRAPDGTDYGACREALALRQALGLEGLIAYTAAGEPAGFLLAGVRGDMAVVHFAKGRRRWPGVFPHLFSRYAQAGLGRVARLNFEQDLGDPGFRRNKRAYGPMALLAKCRLHGAAGSPPPPRV